MANYMENSEKDDNKRAAASSRKAGVHVYWAHGYTVFSARSTHPVYPAGRGRTPVLMSLYERCCVCARVLLVHPPSLQPTVPLCPPPHMAAVDSIAPLSSLPRPCAADETTPHDSVVTGGARESTRRLDFRRRRRITRLCIAKPARV